MSVSFTEVCCEVKCPFIGNQFVIRLFTRRIEERASHVSQNMFPRSALLAVSPCFLCGWTKMQGKDTNEGNVGAEVGFTHVSLTCSQFYSSGASL